MERVFLRLVETHNMIAGNQLAAGHVDQTSAAPSAGSILRTAFNEFSLSARIVEKLRATIESHAPVGYENETGFHYNGEASDGFFSI